MIARPIRRPGPIPFADAALQAWMASHSHGSDRSSGAGKGKVTQAAPSTVRPAQQSGLPPRRDRDMRATFHGHGVLSVRSSATGALYRFDGHGACLTIDPRDALLLGRLSDVHVG